MTDPAPARRRWPGWVLLGAGLTVAAVGLFVVARFVPYVRDDIALDRLVRAVALDWRDFGLDKARERLQYELDHEGIGLQVSDTSCVFEDQANKRTVRCAWSAEVDLLLVPWRVPVSFASVAVVDADGSLR